jgi:hypothetical protein
MKKRTILIGLALLVAVSAWYWFRPELLFIDSSVDEAFPSSAGVQATPLAHGTFHSVAHETKGVATVYELPGSRRVLRLTDFQTSNGPAVYVYLVAAPDAQDSRTVSQAATLDLGPLKGNRGDQNYDLPADADLTAYRSVTIWCKRFSVNFATAPLTRLAPGRN